MASACNPRVGRICIALLFGAFVMHILAEAATSGDLIDTTGLKWTDDAKCQWVGVAPDKRCWDGYQTKCCNCTSCKKDNVAPCETWPVEKKCPDYLRAAFCIQCPETPSSVTMVQNNNQNNKQSTSVGNTGNSGITGNSGNTANAGATGNNGGTNGNTGNAGNNGNSSYTAATSPAQDKQQSPGELAGIIVGSVGAAASVLAVVGYFYYKGKKKARAQERAQAQGKDLGVDQAMNRHPVISSATATHQDYP